MNKVSKSFPGVPDVKFSKPCCVVRQWAFKLSFKQQTVLLTALRGVDGKEKQDMSKNLCKAMRMTILHNASPGKGTFMQLSIPDGFVSKFVENIDHYPVHWVLHFTHAAEIIGYKCPYPQVREWWHDFYLRMVDAMHLQPETEEYETPPPPPPSQVPHWGEKLPYKREEEYGKYRDV